jgi:hypothetical protein
LPPLRPVELIELPAFPPQDGKPPFDRPTGEQMIARTDAAQQALHRKGTEGDGADSAGKLQTQDRGIVADRQTRGVAARRSAENRRR